MIGPVRVSTCRGLLCVALSCLLTLPLAPAPAADTAAWQPKTAAGPHRVETLLDQWHDAARQRDVPVKIYYPADGAGPFAVVVFSHGLGGSRDGYEFLGRHWASHGYVSVHLQHKGSDSSVWQGDGAPLEALRRAAADVRNAIDRPKDVSFALDRLAQLNRDDQPLGRRLDLDRVGMAGHSFGAYTTIAVAGQAFLPRLGQPLSLRDPRVKAAIPMSAPVPRKGELDAVYGPINIPCLHMTGTLDDSPLNETTAEQRRLPFDHMNASDQYLVTFVGGDHMIFSGRIGLLPRSGKDPLFQELIRAGTTAFWDAYLHDDPQAKAWLAEGAYARLLADNGRLEVKLHAAPRTPPPAKPSPIR